MRFVNTKELKAIWKENYIKIIGVLLIIAISAFLVVFYGNRVSHKEIKRIMLAHKELSILVFLLIYSLKSLFVILPSIPLIVFAGSIYGPLGGFVLSMAGAALSATCAFSIARKAGADFIHRILGNNAKYLNNKVDDYGIRIIAVMRAAFVIPFDILSYLAGLTKMKYRDFIIGTLVGITAEMFSLAFLGSNIRKPHSRGFILSIVTIIVVIAVPMIYSKVTDAKKGEEAKKD